MARSVGRGDDGATPTRYFTRADRNRALRLRARRRGAGGSRARPVARWARRRFPVRAPTYNESAVCAPAAARAPPPPRPLSPRLCRVSLSSRCPCRRSPLRDTCLRRGPARGAVSLGCREARSTVDAVARRSTSSRAGRRGRPAAGAASRGERGVAQPQATGRPGRPLGRRCARSTIAAEIKRLMLKNKACNTEHTHTNMRTMHTSAPG
jgi:hypothetical protein